MSKTPITEEDNLQEEWYKIAESTTDLSQLVTFIGHLMDDYEHDYGTYVHAVAASALATVYATGKELSGFQAGCVMWQIIRKMLYANNKTGLKLIDYDEFLFPQYKHHFDKYISEETWSRIQEEAANKLAEAAKNTSYVSPKVIDHWVSIIEGNVPFGYSVEKEL